MGQSHPASFCLFSFLFKQKFAEKLKASAGFELGSSDRRRAHWPLGHHHGPKNWYYFIYLNEIFSCKFHLGTNDSKYGALRFLMPPVPENRDSRKCDQKKSPNV